MRRFLLGERDVLREVHRGRNGQRGVRLGQRRRHRPCSALIEVGTFGWRWFHRKDTFTNVAFTQGVIRLRDFNRYGNVVMRRNCGCGQARQGTWSNDIQGLSRPVPGRKRRRPRPITSPRAYRRSPSRAGLLPVFFRPTVHPTCIKADRDP